MTSAPLPFDTLKFLKELRDHLSEDEAKHLVAYCDDIPPGEAIYLLDPIRLQAEHDEMHLSVFSNCKTLVLVFGEPGQAVEIAAEVQYSSALFLSFFRNVGVVRDSNLSHLAVANLIDSARVLGTESVKHCIQYLAHLASTAPERFTEARFFSLLGALTLSCLEQANALSIIDWRRLEATADSWTAENPELARELLEDANDHFVRAGWWNKCVHAAAKEAESFLPATELPTIKKILHVLA